MILDRLENAAVYYESVPGLAESVQAIKEFLQGAYEKGRYPIRDEDIILIASEYEPKPLSEDSFLEAHRKYLDIMYMVAGEEMIYVKPTGRLKEITRPYAAQSDDLLAKVDSDLTAVRLQQGQFVVLFPQDAHCPACQVDGVERVKKIIVKLKYNQD